MIYSNQLNYLLYYLLYYSVIVSSMNHPHPYLVYQTLNNLSLNQLRQLAKEFNLSLKQVPKKKHNLIRILMHPNLLVGGARSTTDTPARKRQRTVSESTENLSQSSDSETNVPSNPSVPSIPSSSSVPSNPSAPLANPYLEMCGEFNKIDDPKELADALAQGLVPYIDPILQSAIEPNDLVVISGRCYSKQSMRTWAQTFVNQTRKPKTPDTRETLTFADIQKLDLDPMIFIHTYSRGPDADSDSDSEANADPDAHAEANLEANAELDQSAYQLESDLFQHDNCVAWGSNGQQLATGGNGGIILWDFASRQPVKVFGNHQEVSGMNDLAWRGYLIVSVGYGKVMLWNTLAPDHDLGLSLLTNNNDYQNTNFTCVEISYNGHYVAVGTTDARIFVWDLRQLRSLHISQILSQNSSQNESQNLLKPKYILTRRPSHPSSNQTDLGEIVNLSWSPDSLYLSSTNNNCLELLFWDMRSGVLVDARTEITCPFPVAWNPNPIINQVLVTGNEDGYFVIWNAITRRPIRTITSEPQVGNQVPITCLAWRPDGRVLACGRDNGEITFLRYAVGSRLFQVGEPISAHSGQVYNLDWSPNGDWLASCSGDGNIKIWNARLEF